MHRTPPFAVVLAASLAACSSKPGGTSASSHGAASSGSSGSSGSVSSSAGAGSGGSTGSGGHGGQAGHGGMGGHGGADPCATALLCDDFEAYAPGSPPGGKWTVSTNNGAVVVDTGRAHSGSRAVKVSADATSGYRSAMISLADPSLLPVAGNVVYGRMMFWLESAPQGNVHWTFIDGSGPVSGQGYHAVYRYGGQTPITQNSQFVGSELMANYDTPDSYQSPPVGPSSDCWLHANQKVVPVGGWACAEWRFDGPKNEMHFWLDGAEVPDLTVAGLGQGCVHQNASFPWLAPSFERIELGWESYQADEARVLWIDDVVLSKQRIGCP